MSRFYIENYGCQMNVSEADSLREFLIANGHDDTETPDTADIVIINTCSVRKTAEERVIGRIGYYRGENLNNGKHIQVALMGCMAQNMGPQVRKKYSDVVTSIWGTYNKNGILDFMNGMRAPANPLSLDNYHFMDAQPQGKFPFKAYLPISHGCNNFCSYCIVPHVRGREVHRPMKDILENVYKLMDKGVKEITLLGQNVNSYQDGATTFPELLSEIAAKTSIPRLTFLTSHPKDFGTELVQAIQSHANIMRLVHLPIQAGNNRVLKLMNRKYTVEEYLQRLDLARTIPGVSITTDLIIGFPTETEAEYQDTLELVKQVRYQDAFTYQYNTRPGTPAEKYEDQITEEEKTRRLSQLITIQRNISQEFLADCTGNVYNILIESVSKRNRHEIAGRTHNGVMVFMEGDASQIGTLTKVKILSPSGSGLKGIIQTDLK